MGESTYWYQPELLGTVPSLAAKELWNIFVRAGFLYSPLQTFSDCTLTKRPMPQCQSLLPTQKASESSGDLQPSSPLTSEWDLHMLRELRKKVHHMPLTPVESLSLSTPGPHPNFPNSLAQIILSFLSFLTKTTAAMRNKGFTGCGNSQFSRDYGLNDQVFYMGHQCYKGRKNTIIRWIRMRFQNTVYL